MLFVYWIRHRWYSKLFFEWEWNPLRWFFFFGDPKSDFVFSNSVPISRIMLRCIYGCQKWIPDKILHRNDDPIFFSTFIFSLKKISLKMKNIFSSKCPPLASMQGFWEKTCFSFPKLFFQRKNKSWEKNWIIISM